MTNQVNYFSEFPLEILSKIFYRPAIETLNKTSRASYKEGTEDYQQMEAFHQPSTVCKLFHQAFIQDSLWIEPLAARGIVVVDKGKAKETFVSHLRRFCTFLMMDSEKSNLLGIKPVEEMAKKNIFGFYVHMQARYSKEQGHELCFSYPNFAALDEEKKDLAARICVEAGMRVAWPESFLTEALELNCSLIFLRLLVRKNIVSVTAAHISTAINKCFSEEKVAFLRAHQK